MRPDLALVALDVLALTTMSDECERLFSSAKLILTDRRFRLRMDIIERVSACMLDTVCHQRKCWKWIRIQEAHVF